MVDLRMCISLSQLTLKSMVGKQYNDFSPFAEYEWLSRQILISCPPSNSKNIQIIKNIKNIKNTNNTNNTNSTNNTNNTNTNNTNNTNNIIKYHTSYINSISSAIPEAVSLKF